MFSSKTPVSIKTFQECFDKLGWKYKVDEPNNTVILGMNMECVESCMLVARALDENSFVMYTVFPIKAPEDKRAQVSEYLSRANYGLYHGNFEIDFDDGEIRYKMTAITGGNKLDQDNLARISTLGFSMVDRYGPGILAVLYNGAEPKDAVEEIEKQQQQ